MIQKLTPELIKQWTTQANRWRLDTVQEFTYGPWTLQIRRLGKKNAPHQFEVAGYSDYTDSMMVHRYKSITDALLAVRSGFIADFRATPIDREAEGQNTLIFYFERDDDHHAVQHSVVIKGILTPEQKKVIEDCLEQGKYFVPEQLNFYDRPASEPFPRWCEWSTAYSLTTRQATVDMSTEELVARFQELRNGWKSCVSADGDKTPYLCTASEVRTRTVVVMAKTHDEAAERAKQMVSDKKISMDTPDSSAVYGKSVGFATAADITSKEVLSNPKD